MEVMFFLISFKSCNKFVKTDYHKDTKLLKDESMKQLIMEIKFFTSHVDFHCRVIEISEK